MFSLGRFDENTQNGGELESLVEGRSYTVTLNKNMLGCLGSGRGGTKDELLGGTVDEKRKIWETNSVQYSLRI